MESTGTRPPATHATLGSNFRQVSEAQARNAPLANNYLIFLYLSQTPDNNLLKLRADIANFTKLPIGAQETREHGQLPFAGQVGSFAQWRL
jgi:hypothetical protein